MSDFKTITYSRVGSLNIQLDLYLPSFVTSGHLPSVIFFHGGGMVFGNRYDIYFPTWMRDSVLKKGFIFISADYRLIYPSTGFDIIDDMKALFNFLSSSSFSTDYLPAELSLDANRIAVVGASGGGYPAFVAGLHAAPKPKAVFSLFGMGGDLLSDEWLAIRAGGLPGDDMFTVNDDDTVTAALLANPPEAIADAPVVLRPELGGASDMYGRRGLLRSFRRAGDLLDYVMGRPGLSALLRDMPYEERLGAVPKELLPALPQAQFDDSFPPTYLLHGAIDQSVVLRESEKTYARLKELGVRVELDVVENAVHGLFGPTMPLVMAPGGEEAQERAMEFLAEELLRD